MNTVTIRSHKTFLPADYIGSLDGGLLPEMFRTVQYDTEHYHVIELAVPGMTSHDIKVELKNPILWIRAQQTVKDPVTGKREVRGLPYQRSFIVPRNCEAGIIDAKCRNGILTILIKKSKARKPVRISVTGKSNGKTNWLRRMQDKATSLFN